MSMCNPHTVDAWSVGIYVISGGIYKDHCLVEVKPPGRNSVTHSWDELGNHHKTNVSNDKACELLNIWRRGGAHITKLPSRYTILHVVR